MPRQSRLIQLSLRGRIFLCVLAIVYLGYLVALVNFLRSSAPAPSITEHLVDTSPDAAIKHWTMANMLNATEADQQYSNAPDLTQESSISTRGTADLQEGQPARNAQTFGPPLSTIGKVFFTNAGRDYVCSGTAVKSLNHNVVDTAGHCLWNRDWVQNLVFCPLYNNGDTPYGCWAARDLEVPSDWIKRQPLYHDFGMAIVTDNNYGALTDTVGGAGWAYNQPVDQAFYAYGYPAGPPYDGQTRQSCEPSSGTIWKHGNGTVVSIPCGMTGGSSGGPWFIQIGNNWYIDGHNDFTSSVKPGHMFSPYYDDTWYALYDKAQHT